MVFYSILYAVEDHQVFKVLRGGDGDLVGVILPRRHRGLLGVAVGGVGIGPCQLFDLALGGYGHVGAYGGGGIDHVVGSAVSVYVLSGKDTICAVVSLRHVVAHVGVFRSQQAVHGRIIALHVGDDVGVVLVLRHVYVVPDVVGVKLHPIALSPYSPVVIESTVIIIG